MTGEVFEEGNLGHRPAAKGGYFPVPPVDSGTDLRAEMVSVMAEMGLTMEKHHHEVAPSQHELGLRFDTLTAHRRQHADLQVRGAQRRPLLRQDGDLHAQAGVRRQRLGHARAPVDLEGRPAALRRRRLRRAVRDGAVLHRRHHQARPGDQRLLEPDHQQLQAADPGLRGAGPAGLLGAQPLGLLPHSLRRRAQGQARRGPLPGSLGQPLPGLCGHADGRPGRHPEQDPSGRSRWTRTSTTCRPRS